jgi:choline dehydrogenase
MTLCDYVIVGGGTAGCVLASRLTEDGRMNVLLLEAGAARSPKEVGIPAAWPKLLRSAQDWGFRSEAQPHLGGRRLLVPRGKTLGGCSATNVQMYLRGHRADYDAWARLGNAGWAYDDVLPYFRRSEHNSRGASAHHGVGGPLAVSDLRDPNPLTAAFVRACMETGIPENPDPNGAELDGAAQVQVTQRAGRRCSAANAFRSPARRRPNLEVVTDAHATRIRFDGRRATGVEYLCAGRRATAAAAREVLVAAGTIASPQLLMLSGVGPAAELRRHGIAIVHDAPGVGRDLVDHPLVCMHTCCTRPVTLASAETLANVLRYFLLHRGPLTSNGAEAAAFVRTRADLPAPDLEIPFAAVLYAREWETPPREHGFTIGAVALQPRSRGTVRLGSPDPLAPPLIDPRLVSDPADLELLVYGVRLARRILAAPALREWSGGELTPGVSATSDDALRDFVRANVHTIYHPVGTCRMGTDAGAVVDSALRVHGVDGLRVVDASVMPTIPRGHTLAATVMIGEKAADLVRAA